MRVATVVFHDMGVITIRGIRICINPGFVPRTCQTYSKRPMNYSDISEERTGSDWSGHPANITRFGFSHGLRVSHLHSRYK